MRQARGDWPAARPDLDPARVVLLGETGASAKMARRYARGPTHERVTMAAPCGHRHTTAAVAAPRADGLTAPTVVDGAATGEVFEAPVRQPLVPTPRRGDAVVMGDPRCHQPAGARAAIAGAGCGRRFLPPSSPDLHPIERAFAKLKALLRSAGQRTVEGVWRFLGRALDAFAPDGCRNYLRHCGYDATRTRKMH